jgi:hypothetical protein
MYLSILLIALGICVLAVRRRLLALLKKGRRAYQMPEDPSGARLQDLMVRIVGGLLVATGCVWPILRTMQ